MSEVDVFSPFQRRADGHEDRLTWGLLVALKYSPELQRFLRNLVLREIPEDRWPASFSWEPAAVSTQTGRIGSSAVFAVSVLLSDESLAAAIPVGKSDRTARYDAVVEYSDGLVLIIENKPSSGDVWPGQLSLGRHSFEGSGGDVEVFEHAISLEWADLLEGLLAYTGAQIASFAERSLASDFLKFAESFHPGLSPYRTFELCGTRPEALAKRIEGLLEAMADMVGYEVRKRPGGAPYIHLPNQAVKQVHLRARETSEIELSLWPGDTVHQARALFGKLNKPAFLGLAESGWKVAPNLHFSHMQKHLVGAKTPMPVPEYLEFFASNPREVGQTSFADRSLAELSSRWLDLGLISREDVGELDRHFGQTRRSFINVIPGFYLNREWPMPAILELESQDRLELELWDALASPFAAWGDSVPAWVST